MYSLEQVLQVAQAIRPRLSDLLEPDAAAEIDRQLAPLLKQGKAGDNVENQILVVLAEHDATREAAFALLNPKGISDNPTRFHQLPGTGTPQEFPRFKCSVCGFVWSQLEPDEPVPLCEVDKTHGLLQPI
ncbi:hypothetical protein [Sphaerothrix gracilis]|uniref:hypothetical protein n=1 Tax=Sphaerothrix gracilis TaxID=3151835 RepID=UPI0031FE0E66